MDENGTYPIERIMQNLKEIELDLKIMNVNEMEIEDGEHTIRARFTLLTSSEEKGK